MNEKIELIGKVILQSEKAILFQEETCTRDEAVWLPLSQLDIINEDEKTGEIEVSIPEWLAKKNRLV